MTTMLPYEKEISLPHLHSGPSLFDCRKDESGKTKFKISLGYTIIFGRTKKKYQNCIHSQWMLSSNNDKKKENDSLQSLK